MALNKKSQLTMFIIIGIIMILVFSFAFYMRFTLSKGKLEGQTRRIVTDLTKSAELKVYFTNCLDSKFSEGLDLIGKQGGFIHNYGRLIDWEIPYFEYNGSNVSYQIYVPSSNLVLDPPFYPCYLDTFDSQFPGKAGQKCNENYNHEQSFMFGSTGDRLNLIEPELCSKNDRLVKYKCTCTVCKYTIQQQLENFVKETIGDCINQAELKKRTGYETSPADINVNVSIGMEDVSATLYYPLIFKSVNDQSIAFLKYSVRKQVRLKTLYNDLVRPAITMEITNISYDITKDIYDLLNEKGITGIEVTQKSYPEDKTDIIIFNDSLSSLYGKPYIFQFAVENRRPALDYYSPDKLRCRALGLDCDVYVTAEKEDIVLVPKAYDPDEEFSLENNNLIYDYKGWKDEDFKASNAYTSGEECQNKLFRCAILPKASTFGEYGEKELTVNASDPDGLDDFQTINIFVDDIPTVVLTGNNLYEDINNEYASIEDPYKLDASRSSTRDEEVLEFSWSDSSLDPIFDIPQQWSETNKIFKIPVGVGFNDINQLLFPTSEREGYFTVEGPREITVKARKLSREYFGEDSITLTVHQCLPHRSDAPPYPFNDISWYEYQESNPFLADHACCVQDGDEFRFKESGQLCFKNETYGCLSDFEDRDGVKGFYYYGPLNIRNGDENAVYEQTISAKCSGDRGNMCDPSTITHTIEKIDDCEAGNICKRESEVCVPCPDFSADSRCNNP